eukprot:1416729-Prymnesium_polylepis.1
MRARARTRRLLPAVASDSRVPRMARRVHCVWCVMPRARGELPRTSARARGAAQASSHAGPPQTPRPRPSPTDRDPHFAATSPCPTTPFAAYRKGMVSAGLWGAAANRRSEGCSCEQCGLVATCVESSSYTINALPSPPPGRSLSAP